MIPIREFAVIPMTGQAQGLEMREAPRVGRGTSTPAPAIDKVADGSEIRALAQSNKGKHSPSFNSGKPLSFCHESSHPLPRSLGDGFQAPTPRARRTAISLSVTPAECR